MLPWVMCEADYEADPKCAAKVWIYLLSKREGNYMEGQHTYYSAFIFPTPPKHVDHLKISLMWSY